MANKRTVTDLLEMAGKQFQYQQPMKSLWQVVADHFYPERADFTISRNIGSEFADHLLDSYPLLLRRDLGDSLHAMLRDGRWFKMTSEFADDHLSKWWLNDATNKMYKLFGRQESGFTKAAKQGDHDFVTFGNTVKSCEINRKRDGLLFRTWHLRDCAWFEDETGMVGGVFRKWSPQYHTLLSIFGEDALSPAMKRECEKTGASKFGEVDIMHIVLPMEMYEPEAQDRNPYISLYVDTKHQHIIEEKPINHRHYVVPRFQTISGCAYAYSPATAVGLADARCLQAMTHTLMEAAERYARPPLVATQNVVKSGIDLGPDGITYVDEKYDERLGEALRTIRQDRGGWPIGDAERERITATLESVFYRNRLTLPEAGTEMTAFEVQERMKQYRRENLPLFAPIEAEDNGQVCELAFEIAMSNGLLGSPYDVPPNLRGADVTFEFESPLTPDEKEEAVRRFSVCRDMLAGAIELDPNVGADINLRQALRDATLGSGAPARWVNTVEQANEQLMLRQLQEQAAMAAGAK